MKIPSGTIDQYIYFVAVDGTDLKTRETGLAAFTVYRSRNGSAAVAYVTPTVTEINAAFMPGVYALLIDEDTTIAATHVTEEYVVHITHAGMSPVTRSIELFDPNRLYTAGAIEWPYIVSDSVTSLPIQGVDVWVTTDAAGTNTIWRGTTDALGAARDGLNVQPMLDAGTYYFWRQRSGYVFNNPDTEVVS